MVELNITGCCDDCPHIELDMKRTTIPLNCERLILYSISCIHEKVCGKLEKELSDGKADENV